MRSPRPTLALLALIVPVLVAGCLSAPQGGSEGPDTTVDSGTVLTVSVANQSRAAAAPNATRVRFQELSPDRKDEFLSALDGDVPEPAQWGPGTDVQYVRYRGTWYFVTVVVVN